MLLFAIVTLYPVLNTLAYSFNEGNDAVRGGIHLLPRSFSTRNYEEIIFERKSIMQGLWVTIGRTLLGTITSLAANALLSFILSRKKFLFKSSLSLFWIITMYANGGMIPVLILYRYLHLTSSFWVYIVPGLVSAFNVMVMRTYMQGIPDSLEEAAQLEGAGYMTVFVKIITPLCMPVYATTPSLIQASMMVPPQLVWMIPTGTFNSCRRERPKNQPTEEKCGRLSGEDSSHPPNSVSKLSCGAIPVERATVSMRTSAQSEAEAT